MVIQNILLKEVWLITKTDGQLKKIRENNAWPKQEVQQRNRNPKKKKTELLKLKNTIAELKKLIELQMQTQPCISISDLEYSIFEIMWSEKEKVKRM